MGRQGNGTARFEITALVMQGGGALGSYQAGVYQGLAESGIHPNWIAGISIGALNAAIIAGNPPERRVDQLLAFWDYICRQPHLPRSPHIHLTLPHGDKAPTPPPLPPTLRAWLDGLEATRALMEGQNGFFVPRSWLPFAFGMADLGPGSASFYDTSQLRSTLERYADFDRINRPDEMRVSVGAVNVRTGNFAYFDNTETTLKPEHFMASGALPPGFPAVQIEDGEYYWDGGLVSNTPLAYVLMERPRRNALIFQIDLWSATGRLPENLLDVASRQKDIQYSSRTRLVSTMMQDQQNFRRLLHDVMDLVPPDKRHEPAFLAAKEEACDARRNLIHLIYRDKPFEGHTKDYQFGLLAMREHWDSGLADIRHTLSHPEWLKVPTAAHPFVTHDVHRLRDPAGAGDPKGAAAKQERSAE